MGTRVVGRDDVLRMSRIRIYKTPLSKDYALLVRNVALSGKPPLQELTERIANDARWIEDGMGPTMRDSMLAAIGEANPSGPKTAVSRAQIRTAAERALEYARAAHDLRRASSVASLVGMG